MGWLSGPRCLGEALRLLRRHRELWPWAAAPVLTTLLAFGLAVAVFVSQLDALSGALQGWLGVAEPDAWYGWLWVGPLRLLAWLAKGLLLIVFGLALYLGFTLIGGVIASPFLDTLSERVERLVGVEPPAPDGSALARSLRSALEEGRRALFFVGVALLLFGVGLVPGLQPLSAAAAVGFAAWFLPLDYTGYALDRRDVPFRERRRWLWQHRGPMLTFGAASMLTFVVPGLNFLCLPWLVTAGTLLALRVGPPVQATGGEGLRRR